MVRGEENNPFDDVEENYSGQQLGDVSTYQAALIAALDDDVISEDEWSMLDSFRTIIQLQPDQHAMIEEAIKTMSNIDSQGKRRLERLQRFNIVCPYNI